MDEERNLKKMISEAKVEKVFEFLLESKQGENIRDEIYHVKTRLENLNGQKLRNTLSFDNYNIEYNKIIEVTLNLVTKAYNTNYTSDTNDNLDDSAIYTSWGFSHKKEFIQILLESQTLGDLSMRNAFISELPQEIKSRLNRNGSPFIEVKNIIETTIAFVGGWKTFFELFEQFEPNSKALSKLKHFVKNQKND